MNAAEAGERLLGRPVAAARRLAGGDLSAVFRLTLREGDTLIAKQAPNAMAEAAMLRAIRASGAPAPEVLAAEGDWLLMEAIQTGGTLDGTWPDLARTLDLLHTAKGANYGWPTNHAFGPVAIDNRASADWPTFWADRRLRCHLPYVRVELARRIERVADRMHDRLPRHPAPSLLHGDLWGGNILVSGDRIAGLIDPACYHGDREVDVAMLTLFDRPPQSFLQGLGLEPGWEARLALYRLWPLIVHLRLFGDSYADSVGTALTAAGC